MEADALQENDAVHRLRSTLGRLVEVSELNTNEIEPTTRSLVAEALDVLRETAGPDTQSDSGTEA